MRSLGKKVTFLSSFGRIFAFLYSQILFCSSYFLGLFIGMLYIPEFFTLQYIKLRVKFIFSS